MAEIGPGPVGFPEACGAKTAIAIEPLAPRLAARRLRRRGGRRVVIVDGTARPDSSTTQATWGKPEVADRPVVRPDGDPNA